MKARIYTSILEPINGILTVVRQVRKVEAPTIEIIRNIVSAIEVYEEKTVENIVIL